MRVETLESKDVWVGLLKYRERAYSSYKSSPPVVRPRLHVDQQAAILSGELALTIARPARTLRFLVASKALGRAPFLQVQLATLLQE
ncbi:hypothetical protein GOP47_0008583 [Adiantum capillus-veneris]|uniref:Uncharacterized protein n=1 Tax=Adiantum capillus-veneris TaxID=13818 RepID=A0A9D4UZL4_ADICA|nr:hypothetical protein GOP47_0008583 [Adiantum capillus-veneris]